MSLPVGPLEVIPDEMRARRFVLNRVEDPTGISGTGTVAWGVLWPDGTASVRWNTQYRSSVTYEQGIVAVEAIHGHEGKTEIVFLDEGWTSEDGPMTDCKVPGCVIVAVNPPDHDSYHAVHMHPTEEEADRLTLSDLLLQAGDKLEDSIRVARERSRASG